MKTRRQFLRALPGGAAAVLTFRPVTAAAAEAVLGSPVSSGCHADAVAKVRHPDPRPGIDGRDVLTAEQLQGFGPDVLELYDMVREVAHVADGIGCACGCSALPTYRSLLTCFHSGGMAMGCAICQGEARLVHRRHGEGQSLDQIRRAIDARWG